MGLQQGMAKRAGSNDCIRRQLQGKAKGAGSSGGKAEKAGKKAASSREQGGGGCLLSLSLLYL
jgi:hypothetical protein